MFTCFPAQLRSFKPQTHARTHTSETAAVFQVDPRFARVPKIRTNNAVPHM